MSLAADVTEAHASRTGEGKLACSLCHHQTRDRYNMRRHLENHIEKDDDRDLAIAEIEQIDLNRANNR